MALKIFRNVNRDSLFIITDFEVNSDDSSIVELNDDELQSYNYILRFFENRYISEPIDISVPEKWIQSLDKVTYEFLDSMFSYCKANNASKEFGFMLICTATEESGRMKISEKELEDLFKFLTDYRESVSQQIYDSLIQRTECMNKGDGGIQLLARVVPEYLEKQVKIVKEKIKEDDPELELPDDVIKEIFQSDQCKREFEILRTITRTMTKMCNGDPYIALRKFGERWAWRLFPGALTKKEAKEIGEYFYQKWLELHEIKDEDSELDNLYRMKGPLVIRCRIENYWKNRS